MGFRDQAADDIEDSNSTNNGDDEELEQIDVDMGETPFVKFSPTTLPTFTFPDEDAGNPIILFKNKQRLAELGDDAENEDGYDLRLLSTRYLGLVVEDISAVTDDDEGFDETVILDTRDDRTDYRIFDGSDDQTTIETNFTKDEDGNPVEDGLEVEYGSRSYKGEEVDEIEGRAILVVDRTASTSVARTLDIRGGPAAGMDENGDVNGGLVEYFPNDADYADNGRYARPFVELRPDLAGERVGIMAARRSEMDDDFAEEIAGDDSRSDMVWYTVFDMETGDSLERGDFGEPKSYTFLEENFDASAGQMPDADWEFVEQYVDAGMPTDEDTILANIEQQADQLSDDPDTGEMVDAIQSMAE